MALPRWPAVKICVVTAVFAASGVPLAQIRLARALAEAGHEVDLIMGRVDPKYTLSDIEGVRSIVLGAANVRGMFLPMWRYLRAKQPDIVFAAEDHLIAVVLLAAILSKSKSKISGSSRVTPFDTYSSRPLTKRWVLKQLMRAVMWRADALTCVSKDMVGQYRQVFASPPHVCVYNIVDNRHAHLLREESVEHDWFVDKSCPVIVAAGALAPWKGFADLIHAVKEVSLRRKVRLVILGDGPLRAELQALIETLGLGDVVGLFGYVANPLKYFARADVFVLSSLVEGLPNVLVEAMLCGCTPVSTDCPTGPREVLQDGKYGYLVPMRDPAAMAAAIEQALDRPIPKAILAEAIEPFEEDTVLKKHFEVLGLANQGPAKNKLQTTSANPLRAPRDESSRM